MRQFGTAIQAAAGLAVLAGCGGPASSPNVDDAARGALDDESANAAESAAAPATTLEGDITPEGLARHQGARLGRIRRSCADDAGR
ncbi:MAG: hypothetical protein R3C42_02505 [Parvularculaceae bacterium]